MITAKSLAHIYQHAYNTICIQFKIYFLRNFDMCQTLLITVTMLDIPVTDLFYN